MARPLVSLGFPAWVATVAVLLLGAGSPQTLAEPPRREVVPGYATEKMIPGVPYDLAGKRIVFTNWNFIQPGDLDWVNDEGKSVYVRGNEDMYASHHVGLEAPFGIRIVARKPRVVGPLERPHRCIIQDGKRYLGWTDNEFFESSDGMTWKKKANLKLDREKDGIYHVFLDSSAPPAERFKAVWTDDGLTKADLDAPTLSALPHDSRSAAVDVALRVAVHQLLHDHSPGSRSARDVSVGLERLDR